jgi:tubulin polyglutamylase TTLL6/13
MENQAKKMHTEDAGASQKTKSKKNKRKKKKTAHSGNTSTSKVKGKRKPSKKIAKDAAPILQREPPKNAVIINLSCCRYDVVAKCALELGYHISRDDTGEEDFNIWFTDLSVAPSRVMKLSQHQKINHFPAMIDICKKDELAVNLNKMRRMCPGAYGFFPTTYCLPREWNHFSAQARAGNKVWIIKPQSGCQGKVGVLKESTAVYCFAAGSTATAVSLDSR